MEPYLLNDEIDVIVRREWKLQCLQMTLRARGSGESVHSGSGWIGLDSDGMPNFVLYDADTTVGIQPSMLWGGGLRGQWQSESDFFVLEAADARGWTWIAEWVEISREIPRGLGTIVRGRMPEIRCGPAECEPTSHLVCVALSEVEIPNNRTVRTITTVSGRESSPSVTRDGWQAECVLGSVELMRRGPAIRLNIASEEARIKPDATLRLEEALSFVLGAPIKWMIECYGGPTPTVLVRHVRDASRLPRLRPPVEFDDLEAFPEVAALFNAFLKHILESSPGGTRRHPLGLIILTVLRASAAMLEDEVLVGSVQVEAHLKSHFIEERSPDGLERDALDEAVRHLDAWAGPPALKNRLKALIGNTRGPSSETAIKHLIQRGILDERHRTAWRELRHPSAHGGLLMSDIRKVSDDSFVVHDLLLRLIFHVIGYSMRYTDHTQLGWPLVAVPKSAASASEFDPTWTPGQSGEVL